MSNNDVRKLGVDPGFGGVKLAEVRGDGIGCFRLPAAVGLADRGRKDGLTLAGVVSPGRMSERPVEVGFDGVEFLVGPNVDRFTRPVTQMDFERFGESLELRATVYAGLFSMLNGGSHRVALAVALPVEVVQDKSEAQRVERAMRGWLVGDHRFVVGDQDVEVEVVQVRAKIPQPVATWFDWGMDYEGQWVRGRDALKAPALVVDVGFNTLDVLVVEDGAISQRFSGGDTLGMRRAAERLMDVVDHRYGVGLELYEANGLVEDFAAGGPVWVYVQGEAVDVRRDVGQAVRALGNDVLYYLERNVGRAGASYKVLLTGGGAVVLSKRLLARFEGGMLMTDPVMANARGLAKLANRAGFLGT